MNEQIIYQDTNVLVSTTRLVIDGTTYALRNLTSVRMAEARPSWAGPVMILFLDSFAGLVGFGKGMNGEGWGLAIGSGVVFALCLLALFRSSIYSVVVLSTAGERPALEATDRDRIERVVEAINAAIIQGH